MTPDHDIDSEHVYPPHKWSAEMGKPFDEERAPRMDATSRAAAEIDRLHTAEAKVEVLSVELRALNQVNAENIKLRQMLAAQQDENERLRAAAHNVGLPHTVDDYGVEVRRG